MSKLLSLKKYFSIEEATKHLSKMFDEEVTADDIYHIAQEGGLTLSLYFPTPVFGLKMSAHTLSDANVGVWMKHTYKGQTVRYLILPDCHLTEKSKKSMRRYLEDEELTKQDHTTLKSLYKSFSRIIPDSESPQDGSYIDYEGSPHGDNQVIEYLNNEIIQVDGLWDLPMLWSNDTAIKKRLERPFRGPEIRESSNHGFVVMRENTERKEGEPKYTNVHIGRYDSLSPKGYKEAFDEYPPLDTFPIQGSLVIKATELIKLKERATNVNIDERSSDESNRPSYYTALKTQSSIELHENTSSRLKIAIQANHEFWSSFDPDDLRTAPKRRDVIDWLTKENDFPVTLAESVDTLLRDSRSHPGGRPKIYP
ncbi:MAG: hypothetical protein HRU04_05635 [Oceanospirillaceae bacterium]|nr:hypothetical protein [Oceanospirillaceae bacterium]